MTGYLSFMQQALSLAHKHLGQTWPNPAVGAIIVKNNQIIGEGTTAKSGRPHAETIALTQAGEQAKDATLYVTLEPCALSVGAMIQARIKRLVFGAYDVRAGAVASVFQLLDEQRLNHSIAWQGGVMADECAAILKSFFQQRR